MSDIAERAERLLAGITPVPWWWTNELRQRLIAGGSEDDLSDAREIVRCAALLHPDKADAEFIAAAPQLVADLLAEVKRLEGDLQMVADFAGAATDVRDIVRQLRAQRCVVASLSAEVKRLRDVMDELTDVQRVHRRQNTLVCRACNDVGGGTYVFLDTAKDAIHFGHMAGPTGRLSVEQLRTIGDYCRRAADRIEERIGGDS